MSHGWNIIDDVPFSFLRNDNNITIPLNFPKHLCRASMLHVQHRFYLHVTILPDAWDMLERSPRIVRGRQSCSPTYWATPRTVTIACTQSTLEGYSGGFSRTLDIWITSVATCRTSHLRVFTICRDWSIYNLYPHYSFLRKIMYSHKLILLEGKFLDT